MQFNDFYIKAIIDELVSMLFELYDEISCDGGLGGRVKLQIETAKLCHELYYHICDDLLKTGKLPEEMFGNQDERQPNSNV